jgi:hypothetical protein
VFGKWCYLNIGKTTIILFIRRTIDIHFNYDVCPNLILRSQYVKDLGVALDCMLYFHPKIDCVSYQGLKMLCLILYITFHVSDIIWIL